MDRSFYEKEIQTLKQLIHRVNDDAEKVKVPDKRQTNSTDALWIALFLFGLVFGLVGFMTWWLLK